MLGIYKKYTSLTATHMYEIQNVQNDKLYPMRDVKTAAVRLVYLINTRLG